MSLESLLAPAKWLDTQVMKQYTKLGQHIPERQLYKITTGLYVLGLAGGCQIIPGRSVHSFVWPVFYGMVAGSDDLGLNIDGLRGKLPRYVCDRTKSIDSLNLSRLEFTRIMRLPLFIGGIAAISKVAYDTIDLLADDTMMQYNPYRLAFAGIGFLCSASSMYLKDQDPKLLDKQQSKLKGWATRLYDKAKEAFTSPSPIPILHKDILCRIETTTPKMAQPNY